MSTSSPPTAALCAIYPRLALPTYVVVVLFFPFSYFLFISLVPFNFFCRPFYFSFLSKREKDAVHKRTRLPPLPGALYVPSIDTHTYTGYIHLCPRFFLSLYIYYRK